MRFEKIQEFYENLLDSEDMKPLEEKLKKVTDKKSYRDFIRTEIIPKAEEMGYDFAVDDILSYDEMIVESLSEEELVSVTGGSIKNIPGVGGLFALLFMIGGGSTVSAVGVGKVLPGDPNKTYQTESEDIEEHGVRRDNTDDIDEIKPYRKRSRVEDETQIDESAESFSSRALRTMPYDRSEYDAISISSTPNVSPRYEVNDELDDYQMRELSTPMADVYDEMEEKSSHDTDTLMGNDAMPLENETAGNAKKMIAEEHFMLLYEENKRLNKSLQQMENKNSDLSDKLERVAELKEIMEPYEGSVQRILKLEYLPYEIFNRIKSKRSESLLTLSRDLGISDLTRPHDFDLFDLSKVDPQWIENLQSENLTLERKIAQFRLRQYKYNKECSAFDESVSIEKLLLWLDDVYSATEDLNDAAELVLLDGDRDLDLMQNIDKVKIEKFKKYNFSGRSLFREDDMRPLLKVTKADIIEAWFWMYNNTSLEVAKREGMDAAVNSEWFDCAFSRIQQNYDMLNEELKGATELLKSCEKCIMLSGKTAVVGDIHGYFKDLNLIITQLKSQLAKKEIDHVLFLGDIFDRGPSSFFSLKSLLEFFIEDPEHVHILKGNHDALYRRYVTNQGVFWTDDAACVVETGLRQNLDEILNYVRELPVVAVINREVLAVHGGISEPSEDNVHEFFWGDKYEVEKYLDEGDRTISCAMWSDFKADVYSATGEVNEHRGNGIFFGFPALRRFFEFANKCVADTMEEPFKLQHIVRGHKHELGPFDQVKEDTLTVTTVISAASFVDLYRQDSVEDPDAKWPEKNRDHASVVLLEEGKVPREYFGIICNSVVPYELVLETFAFGESDIEILDIMYPLYEDHIQDKVFAGSQISRIIVHDEDSVKLLSDNRVKYGIKPDAIIELCKL